MATDKQIAANRENAKKSTGPRTEEGKAISRMNALKHGIDAEYEVAWDEYKEELEALTAEYDRQWQPVGIAERVLVDLLVRKQWLMNRQPNISAGLTNYGTAKAVCDPRELHAVGAGYTVNTDSHHRLHRQMVDTERAYFRYLAELEERRTTRLEFENQHPEVVDARVIRSKEKEEEEIGFVSQNPPPAPLSTLERLRCDPADMPIPRPRQKSVDRK